MKNTNLLLKALPFAVLPLAASVQAATESVSVGFKTLPEITIEQTREMSFGSVLSLTPSETCVMTANDSNVLAPALTFASAGTGVAATGTPGALSGQCVTTTPGTVGIYKITAIQGTELQVTLSGSTNADISFDPAGYVIDFDADDNGGDTNTDDDIINITSGTANSQDVFAPTTGEFSANVQPGVVGLVLGGTIVNQRALLADTAVEADFTIDVIYK